MQTQSNVTTSSIHTAKRLISTKDMSRDQWLQVRQNGIGASEAATAVGLNPYQSALELWMIKTGRMPLSREPSLDDERSPMYWGNVLEPIVAEHYSRKTGLKVRKVNAVLQHPDPDKSWMLANLDYAVVGSKDVQVLECKTAGEFGARLWKNGVPEYYQCQVQHQLAITGKKAADVAVLICGQEFKVFRIERDDELIEQLIELERQFWHCVETDTPPPTDGSESADAALRLLYPKDTGLTLDLTNDEASNLLFTEVLELNEQSQQISKREAEVKQQLQQRLGDATGATFKTGRISWKKSKDSVAFDAQSFLKDHPEFAEQYQQVRSGSRRFTIHKNP